MHGFDERQADGTARDGKHITARPSHGILVTLPVALTLWLLIIVSSFELIKWVRLA